MPEGDTIHRAARTLHLALAGKVVVRFETAVAHLARVDQDAPIAGRTVEEVRAAGKHLLFLLSGGLVLRTHLRMSGSWHLYRPGERWRRPRASMRIVLDVGELLAVAFDVPVAEWIRAADLPRRRELARLGPDLLAGTFDAEEAARRLRAHPQAEVGEALLDQSVVAGAGNVFKSEILFVAGVHPFRRVATLTDDEVREVLRVARRLLVMNAPPAAPGRASTWHGGRRTTGSADPSRALWVYGRGGEPCRRCATPVVFARQGPHARVTYLCPRCQPGPA